eukprot:scaffold35342_cov112-Isochrysis_galbana.AAC.4
MGLFFPPLGGRVGETFSYLSGLRILSIGDRRTVGVTKFILGSARGIALFRCAPSSTKLNFSLERTPCLAWGGNRTGSLSPRRVLANRAGTWPKHQTRQRVVQANLSDVGTQT